MFSHESLRSSEIFSWYLGCSITAKVYLCQQKYSTDILSDARLLGAKPLSFSMEPRVLFFSLDSYRLLSVYLFISPLLVRAQHIPFKYLHNLCKNQAKNIGTLLFVYSSTAKELLGKVYFSAKILIYNIMPTMILIRQVAPSLGILLLDILYLWVSFISPGRPRNNILFLDHLLKQNIVPQSSLVVR